MYEMALVVRLLYNRERKKIKLKDYGVVTTFGAAEFGQASELVHMVKLQHLVAKYCYSSTDGVQILSFAPFDGLANDVFIFVFLLWK